MPQERGECLNGLSSGRFPAVSQECREGKAGDSCMLKIKKMMSICWQATAIRILTEEFAHEINEICKYVAHKEQKLHPMVFINNYGVCNYNCEMLRL